MQNLARLEPLWPRRTPALLPRLGCAGSCRSAMEVGGDFYEVVALSETSLLVAIADVMGKGVSAALFADSLRTYLRALAQPGSNPAELLFEANCLMFEELSQAGLFITVQLVVVDPFRGRLEIASAGHCPLLLCSPQGQVRALSANGMPLGIEPDASFQCQSCRWPSPGAVLLYTDGITEARDGHGRFFGQRRLENWLSRGVAQAQSAAQLKSSLLNEVSSFQGCAQPLDDQTFVLLCDETPRPPGPDLMSDRSAFAPEPDLSLA